MDIYYEEHKGQKAILEIKNHGYLKSSEKEKKRLENQTPSSRRFHVSATIAAMATERVELDPHYYRLSNMYSDVRDDHNHLTFLRQHDSNNEMKASLNGSQ